MEKDKLELSSADLEAANAALAVRIRQGEHELLPELWAGVERLAAWYANRFLYKLPSRAGVEFDDLYDSGYIALADAVRGYDPDRGSFSAYYAMWLKTAFAVALGWRTLRQRRDPLHNAVSLEAPIGSADDLSLGDSISDDAAEKALQSVEDDLYRQQLHEELESALSKLPGGQERVLRRRYYDGMSQQAVANDLHITNEGVRQNEKRALRAISRSSAAPRLYQYAYPGSERRIDQKTNFFRHTGVNRFNSTGISDVEELVFKRETWRERQRDQEFDKMLADMDREIEQAMNTVPGLREKLELVKAKPSRKGGDIFEIDT